MISTAILIDKMITTQEILSKEFPLKVQSHAMIWLPKN